MPSVQFQIPAFAGVTYRAVLPPFAQFCDSLVRGDDVTLVGRSFALFRMRNVSFSHSDGLDLDGIQRKPIPSALAVWHEFCFRTDWCSTRARWSDGSMLGVASSQVCGRASSNQ